jgi:hypothetical protein
MPQLADSAPPLLTFSVCDDVRAEVSGKTTIVGIYGRAVRIANLPSTLPKLCFVAQFDSSFIQAQASAVRTRLSGPSGSVIFETPQVNLPPPAREDPMIPNQYREARLIFQVAPMILNEAGVYTVEFEVPGWPVYYAQFLVVADPSLAASAVPSIS